jgi:hypothetical protein
MDVGQGPNWGCSAKGKKNVKEMAQDGMDWISLAHDKAGSQHGNKPSVSI